MCLDPLIPYPRNPIPSPFHCFQFEVTEATGEEDHPLDPPVPEPVEAQFALVLYEMEGHRRLLPVIPQVAAQHLAAPGGLLLQPSEVVFQPLEPPGIPGPKTHYVQKLQVRGERSVELVFIEHGPEVEPTSGHGQAAAQVPRLVGAEEVIQH